MSDDQNPFDYEDRVISAMRDAAAWLAGRAMSTSDLRESVALMHTELMRLRNTTQLLTEAPREPRPGLSYADPMGRFTCWPAVGELRGEFSPLELRVLLAHLTAATDNVSMALSRKGTGS